jgi:hypothetical protein
MGISRQRGKRPSRGAGRQERRDAWALIPEEKLLAPDDSTVPGRAIETVALFGAIRRSAALLTGNSFARVGSRRCGVWVAPWRGGLPS